MSKHLPQNPPKSINVNIKTPNKTSETPMS